MDYGLPPASLLSLSSPYCDGSGEVTIGDLITIVDVALGKPAAGLDLRLRAWVPKPFSLESIFS